MCGQALIGGPIRVARHGGAVDRKRRRRESAGPEGQLVAAARCVEDAPAVTVQHRHVREHVMAKSHRLRPLQMRVARRDRVDSPITQLFDVTPGRCAEEPADARRIKRRLARTGSARGDGRLINEL